MENPLSPNSLFLVMADISAIVLQMVKRSLLFVRSFDLGKLREKTGQVWTDR